MKRNLSCLSLFLTFAAGLLGCDRPGVNAQSSESPTPATVETKYATPQPDDGNECVRAKPEPVIKTTKFANTSFRLEKNKQAPYQDVGYETVKFDNGDELEIENTGCENYTLIFKFRTKRFSKAQDDTKYWYAKAVEMLELVKPGIVYENSAFVTRGTAALKKHTAGKKALKYGDSIDFGKGEIGESVVLEKVTSLDDGRYEVKVSFGIGPL